MNTAVSSYSSSPSSFGGSTTTSSGAGLTGLDALLCEPTMAERLAADGASPEPVSEASALEQAKGSNTAPSLPPRAPESADIPAVESIAKDPVVTKAIDDAWVASKPDTPGQKKEQGFWVLKDDKTGALSTVAFPSNGTNDSLTPGAKPSQAGKTVVAFFHTHPNTTDEGYVNGPSPADQRFATAQGIPGIIRAHNGMHYFNP